MASMGPFPSERIGRDIDDLPAWLFMDTQPYEWNEFYSSQSWNIAPLEFEIVSPSPPPPPSITSKASKRASLSDSIKSEGEKSVKSAKKRGSIKKKKEKRSSLLSKGSSCSDKKKKKKKKKTKEDRRISSSSRSSCDTLGSTDDSVMESSSEFAIPGALAEPSAPISPLLSPSYNKRSSSSSFLSPFSSRSLGSFSSSFGPLSPSMNSLGGESRSSIMGCDLPEDVLEYIDEVEQQQQRKSLPVPPLVIEQETKKKKKRTSKEDKKKRKSKEEKKKKRKSLPTEEQEKEKLPKTTKAPKTKAPKTPSTSEEPVTDKKTPSSTRSSSAKKKTLETLPEEVMESLNKSLSNLPGRNLVRNLSARSLSPKRKLNKLMVLADGSIRRVVEKNKASFWEPKQQRQQEEQRRGSSQRRASIRKSIDSALGELLQGMIDHSFHLEDHESSSSSGPQTTKGSVATEITDPWHNSWSISSDSFHDNSDRPFRNLLTTTTTTTTTTTSTHNADLIRRIPPL